MKKYIWAVIVIMIFIGGMIFSRFRLDKRIEVFKGGTEIENNNEDEYDIVHNNGESIANDIFYDGEKDEEKVYGIIKGDGFELYYISNDNFEDINTLLNKLKGSLNSEKGWIEKNRNQGCCTIFVSELIKGSGAVVTQRVKAKRDKDMEFTDKSGTRINSTWNVDIETETLAVMKKDESYYEKKLEEGQLDIKVEGDKTHLITWYPIGNLNNEISDGSNKAKGIAKWSYVPKLFKERTEFKFDTGVKIRSYDDEVAFSIYSEFYVSEKKIEVARKKINLYKN